MNTSFKLTDADRALAQGDDGHDTPFQERQSMVLAYGTSPELVHGGPRFAPGAAIGDYVVSQGDKRVVFKNGVLFHVIAFTLTHPEYTIGDGDGDRDRFVSDHGVTAPKDMTFLKLGEGGVAKPGFYRIDNGVPGNRVVPTITAFGLVNGFGVSYAMYGSAFAAGREWSVRARRLRVKTDGEDLVGCALGIFKLTSRFEKKGIYSYPVPVIELAGKLGEPKGPTLEEWRASMTLRKAFREGADWIPHEALDPPAPTPVALPLEGPQRGKMTVISGRQSDRDEAPPVEAYEGPDDDSDRDPFDD
jgi:hypothetical protein